LKAFLDHDVIINLTEQGDTEIGSLPIGVGMERLRFDGEKVIDLADLTEFWVVPVGKGFELHCIEVPNSQLVQMNYFDRKYLRTNNNTIRLKTTEEIDAENTQLKVEAAKTRLRRKLKEAIGDLHDQHQDALALICALIVYVRQEPQALTYFFDDIIPDIKDIFPMNRVEATLRQSAKNLKKSMEEYWQDIDNIGN
jgi:hypothetical protein